MLSLPIRFETFLLIISILFMFSIFVSKAGYKFGVPVLLLFLFIGMLIGVDGLGIHFSNFKVAQAVGIISLVVILFSGGMDTKYTDIKPVAKQGVILSTFGVLLTMGITGSFIYIITNIFFQNTTFSLLASMLLAATMSSTDSASVFALLRSKGLSLKHQLRPMLELESGSNDPMAYMLTIFLIQLMQGEANMGLAVGMFFVQLIVGGIAGYLLGKLAVRIINRINIPNQSLYPVLLLTCALMIFGLTDFIKGNGYLAVYIGGLVIGNAKLVHKKSSTHFFDGLAWLFQIVMFITLGLLVNPNELIAILPAGLAIGFFMIIFSRPIAVFLCLLPFRNMAFRDRLFVSWVGLRGAVPIVFAIYPLAAGLPEANAIFNIVFFITIISLVVQGSTIPKVANLLSLTNKSSAANKLRYFDFEYMQEQRGQLSEVEVDEKFVSKGNRIMDVDIPERAIIMMIKRDDKYILPRGNTELQVHDKLLLVNDKSA